MVMLTLKICIHIYLVLTLLNQQVKFLKPNVPVPSPMIITTLHSPSTHGLPHPPQLVPHLNLEDLLDIMLDHPISKNMFALCLPQKAKFLTNLLALLIP
ncbi:hypothetical protein KY290_027307 [Solanum tuberosum]|uniref:Uncharacterized protein n=1 Tax=Solanum tuberosum TaxID=4113 RepID=A0ABQ7UHX6_SOLTU|nr:hypothetical protein KY290_027307 [Solanum tuberosum]